MTYGQSQRLVLLEEATNASCPPCAAQNPGFNTLIDANSDKTVSIKYQVWYPGYDPMFEHNPDEIEARHNYYPGITGVPTAMIDGVIPDENTPGFGNAYDGAPGAYSQTMIDNNYDIPASFDIDLNFSYTPEEITINATAIATMAASGDLKLHLAVVEKEIAFDSPPGSTDESEFYNVFKKMLPSAAGASMAEAYAVGDEFSITESWNLENIYDYDEIAVVAFIQNDDNKEVLQAAYAESGEFTAEFGQDVSAQDISGLPDFTCESVINPTIEIQNNGSETLTSLDIDYTINDASGTIEWTGNLEFFESETVELGEISFTSEAENTLAVNLSNPNGEEDENTENDSFETEVALAGLTTLNSMVVIRTDYYAGETSWELLNSNDEIIASDEYVFGDDDQFGGGGPDATTTHEYPVDLDPFECYTFNIYDSFGDGMGFTGGVEGAAPFGYQILDGYGEVVTETLQAQYNFGDDDSDAARTEDLVNVNETLLGNSLTIYPNPTTDQLNVEFDLVKSSKLTIDLYNITGKLVMSKDYGTQSAGYSLNRVDLSNLNAGVYMLNINTNDGRVVRKVTVTK
ncbi:MAG: T9SS type A sorting domain-containing protein [Bacteroidetes bacterium]|nr:T9SS type A sorting domain-containing protein [Bacteroidota bacterium]